MAPILVKPVLYTLASLLSLALALALSMSAVTDSTLIVISGWLLPFTWLHDNCGFDISEISDFDDDDDDDDDDDGGGGGIGESEDEDGTGGTDGLVLSLTPKSESEVLGSSCLPRNRTLLVVAWLPKWDL